MGKKYIEPMISAACVGCGECCRRVQCYAGWRVKEGHPCPFLREDRREGAFLSVYRCELMEGPDGEKYKEVLAAGAGCCQPMFNPTREALERQLFEKLMTEGS